MKSPTVKLVNAPSAIGGKVSLQRGLSLIELMISITIGLLILAALSTLFVNQSRARAELDKSNRMIDNGRYALELLSDNLMLAGYYGEFAPTAGNPAIPGTLPDPCSTTAADISAALQLAVQGYDATPASNIASPPCGFTYAAGNDLSLKPGSDILVIRRASTASVTQATTAAAGINGTVYLQVSGCQYDATAYRLSTDPATLTLGQRNITTPAPLLNCFNAGGITTIGVPYADLRPFKVEVYFVSPDNNPGDGIPTLKRRELAVSGGASAFVTTPLVEGIEYMQLEYGLDTDNDGVPDNYVEAPAATEWPNVVAVKINILARNTESTSGYTDTKTYDLGLAGTVTPGGAYKRHAYTQFVRLVNPAGRRE